MSRTPAPTDRVMRSAISMDGAIESVCNEAIVLRTYKDSKGIPTIGVGHTAAAGGIDPAKFRGELTVAEAVELFLHDVARYAADVARAVKVPTTQYEFDALVDFHYNTGAIARASLTKKLNAGDRAGAAAAFMQWKKPPEIIERRERSRDLFLTGKYHQRFALLLPVKANGYPDWAKGRRVDVRALLAAGGNTAIADTAPVNAKPISGPSYITKGAVGETTRTWQRTLIELGYALRSGADGDFGDETLKQTKAFQRAAGILVDGRVGSGTRAAATKQLAAQRTKAPAPASRNDMTPFATNTPVQSTEPMVVEVGETRVTLHDDGAVTIAGGSSTITGDKVVLNDPPATADAVAPDTATVVTVSTPTPVPEYTIAEAGVPVVPAVPDTKPAAANPNSGETSIGARSIKQMGIGAVVVLALTALLNWIGG